jgi:GNAT superfamily N-acetyltransferase
MNFAPRHIRRTTDTSHLELRLAEQRDIPQVVEMLHRFFNETPWRTCLEFANERVADFLAYSIQKGSQPYLCAFDGDRLVGLISWHLYIEACSPIAVMDETYVVPEYRRTTLGRRLVAVASEWAKASGARVMNFPLASGFDETRTFVNMLQKFGARPVGVIMSMVL